MSRGDCLGRRSLRADSVPMGHTGGFADSPGRESQVQFACCRVDRGGKASIRVSHFGMTAGPPRSSDVPQSSRSVWRPHPPAPRRPRRHRTSPRHQRCHCAGAGEFRVTGKVQTGTGYLWSGRTGGIFDFSGTTNGVQGSLGNNPPPTLRLRRRPRTLSPTFGVDFRSSPHRRKSDLEPHDFPAHDDRPSNSRTGE